MHVSSQEGEPSLVWELPNQEWDELTWWHRGRWGRKHMMRVRQSTLHTEWQEVKAMWWSSKIPGPTPVGPRLEP